MILLYYLMVCFMPRNGSWSFKLGPEEEWELGELWHRLCSGTHSPVCLGLRHGGSYISFLLLATLVLVS